MEGRAKCISCWGMVIGLSIDLDSPHTCACKCKKRLQAWLASAQCCLSSAVSSPRVLRPGLGHLMAFFDGLCSKKMHRTHFFQCWCHFQSSLLVGCANSEMCHELAYFCPTNLGRHSGPPPLVTLGGPAHDFRRVCMLQPPPLHFVQGGYFAEKL